MWGDDMFWPGCVAHRAMSATGAASYCQQDRPNCHAPDCQNGPKARTEPHEEVPVPSEDPDALLVTRSLTKEFRGFAAVSDVSLTVAQGTVHALVGPNGAGKTTLFNLLTGFLTPTSGQILFEGRDITGMQPEQIAPL